jgi:hypothetical protein
VLPVLKSRAILLSNKRAEADQRVVSTSPKAMCLANHAKIISYAASGWSFTSLLLAALILTLILRHHYLPTGIRLAQSRNDQTYFRTPLAKLSVMLSQSRPPSRLRPSLAVHRPG